MILKLGDKEIDLKEAFPMTLGDWKAFEKLGIMGEDGKVNVVGSDSVTGMILLFCNKVDPDITEVDMDKMHLKDLKIVSEYLSKMMADEEGDNDADPN